jgi:ADP-ribose pyrophosphatase YjhB (NUDIX family)
MVGMETTWDGLPVASEPPFACCVVVWREGELEREYLVLHRLAPGGPDFEGDWAWTPPSGARQPDEPARAAAARELREETGLTPAFEAVQDALGGNVALFVAEAARDAEVVLDDEHDRFAWLALHVAERLCRPREVAACLSKAAAALDGQAREPEGPG